MQFIPKMHLSQDLHTVLVGNLEKNIKEHKSLKKQMIYLFFNTTWLMDILKIELEEDIMIKYCVIKHLVLLKIQTMMDTKQVLLQWFTNSLIKALPTAVLKMRIF